jgi:hypothetical protein
MAVAACMLALANGRVLACVANAVLGGAFVVATTVQQTLTPDALLGRVNAASDLFSSIARMASVFTTGVLITGVGQRGAILVFAALLALVGCILLLLPSTALPISALVPFQRASSGE